MLNRNPKTFSYLPAGRVVRGLMRLGMAALFAGPGLLFAQSSVNLAWDRTSGQVAGYRLYHGTTSKAYNNKIECGNATSTTVAGLTPGATYFFAAAAYSAEGLESPLSAEIRYTVPTQDPTPSSNLTFAATSGTLSGRFVSSSGSIYQTSLTGVTDGGRAAYVFSVGAAGDYIVKATVLAPNSSANSFFVNIDGEPTDPQMIWDIPPASQAVTRTVSWRGSGAPDNNQYGTKVFRLSAGTHQLIVRGREPNTRLSSITIEPVVVLPPPWQKVQIGNSLAGTATISNGTYTLSGAGNLSGSSDNFTLLYQPLSADGRITARINTRPTTGSNARVGVMIRESLTSRSRYAFAGLSSDGSYRFQRRTSTGGSTSTVTRGSGTPPNTWVRLVRSGSTITAYRSSDGANWTRIGSNSISMASTIYVGLAVASGSASTLNSSTFSNVTVVP